MIKVIYDKKRYKLSIEGHAHCGEFGHDLICAAVSALTYTLAANIENFRTIGAVDKTDIQLQSGSARIHSKPNNKHKASVKLAYDSICVGFEILAHNYPENISYELVE